MFVKDALQKLDIPIKQKFPNTKFLLMFIGVVIGPLALFAIGGSAPDASWLSVLAWALPAIALLLLISAIAGWVMFRSKFYSAAPPTISRNF